MSALKGKVEPLRNKVLVHNMNFGEEVTTAGIVLKSDNGKGHGVKPRWAQVWAIGPDQADVKVGEWVLLEHGRWSRAIRYEQEDGTEMEFHLADLPAMICTADEKPSDIQIGLAAGAGSNVNFNIPGA
jgi:co-chaperonin GroES (HSP10)